MQIYILCILLSAISADSFLKRIHKPTIHIPLTKNGYDVRSAIKQSLKSLNQIDLNQQQSKYDHILEKITQLDANQTISILNELPLKNFYNAQYFGNIMLGSQDTVFSMLFDTGSSYIWVASKDCKGCKNAGITNYFDCSSSITCKPTRNIINLKYGTGEATTYLFTDNIKIGNMQAQGQTILMVENIAEISHFLGDGIIGLGFPTLSNGHPTIMDSLYQGKQIIVQEFSIYLKDENNLNGLSSTLILGGVDTKYMSEKQFHYCPVVSPYYWALSCDSVAFVSKDGKIRKQIDSIPKNSNDYSITSKFTVIDSGTSIIALDQQDYKHLMQFLQSFNLFCYQSQQIKGMHQCDQSDLNKYPNLECISSQNYLVTFCGQPYIIPPEHYLLCEGNMCVILIQSFDYPVSIVGDEFIRQYYTHFVKSNDGNHKIGFAKVVI